MPLAAECWGTCAVIGSPSALAHQLLTTSDSALKAIAIDEAQFFPDLLEFCLEAAERDNKLVVVAGLSGDFRRKKFGEVQPSSP